jgi:hypothetical protein
MIATVLIVASITIIFMLMFIAQKVHDVYREVMIIKSWILNPDVVEIERASQSFPDTGRIGDRFIWDGYTFEWNGTAWTQL